jgi:hypothetical protein
MNRASVPWERRLHGWFYDIESGEIQALDKNTKSFVSLSDNPDVLPDAFRYLQSGAHFGKICVEW